MGTAHFMSPEQAAGEAGRWPQRHLRAWRGRLSRGERPPAVRVGEPAGPAGAPGDRGAAERNARGARAASALGAAIDRCLARDPAGRFADGEALADALAPAADARPALPPTLRAWLGARNPLLVPYLAWSGVVRYPHPGQPHRLAERQPAGGPATSCSWRRSPRRRSCRSSASTSTRHAGSSAPGTRSPICGRRSRSRGGSGPRPKRSPGTRRSRLAPGPAARHGRLGRPGSRSPSDCSSQDVIHENRLGDSACCSSRAGAQHAGAGSGEQCARRAVHSHQDPQLVADGDP